MKKFTILIKKRVFCLEKRKTLVNYDEKKRNDMYAEKRENDICREIEILYCDNRIIEIFLITQKQE